MAQIDLTSRVWRLNNLYKVKTKRGTLVGYKPNAVQRELYRKVWHRNLILKSRQHGVSTGIEMFMADACIWNDNINAAIIAHRLPDGKKLLDKVRVAYNNLHDKFKKLSPLATDSATEISWENGSSISVSTSARSQTVQMLHVSELGHTSVHAPDKASEIVSGAFEAVSPDQYIWVESTAEGEDGEFYDLCQRAQDIQTQGKELSKLDFRFFFFAWYEDPDNILEHPDNVDMTAEYRRYFEELSLETGVELSDKQKAWYIKKDEGLQEKMYSEQPSTPEEAFKASVEGAYYSKQFYKILKENRLTRVPKEDGLETYVSWDLGMDDATALWFLQLYGSEVRVLDYYENSGEGLGHYVDVIRRKGYTGAKHLLPHDIRVKELGSGKTRLETLQKYGINKYEVVSKVSIIDGINATRRVLGYCYFDKDHTEEGVKALRNYKKEWDDKRGVFRRTPYHDWSSHAADAFRYFSIWYSPDRTNQSTKPKVIRREPLNKLTGF